MRCEAEAESESTAVDLKRDLVAEEEFPLVADAEDDGGTAPAEDD